jgi:hypothetical protein
MTPKEKAEQLVSKFLTVYHTERIEDSSGEQTVVPIQIINSVIHAKIYALVAVDEILSMGIMSDSGDWRMAKSYWEEVKQEIEKL